MIRLIFLLSTIVLIPIVLSCEKSTVIEDFIEKEIISVEKQFELPEIIDESSGLIYYNNQIITHNDSGDTSNLYLIDPITESLIETKFIDDIYHTDWEAITQNDSHFFIGDVGNNAGNRTDLNVYQIDKTTFELSKTIAFAYKKQVDFDLENEEHNFNMEAMIWMEDQLYLFSKNHLNLKTYLYSLDPLIDSTQLIEPIDSFDVNGLVTDATYWKATNQLALIGYDNSQDLNTFLYLFDDFNSMSFFNTNSHRLDLDINEQFEGCTFVEENIIWITSEKETNFGGNLYELIFD